MRNNVFFAIVMVAFLALSTACNRGNDTQDSSAGSGNSASAASVYTDDDRAVGIDQLPQKAQDYINNFFPGKTVANVRADDDEYDVFLQYGERLEFDMNGDIKEIECYPEIPSNVIDNRILNDVRSIDPQAKIVKIERKYGGYEVKLNTGMELNYDPGFQKNVVR
ncbi:MAG: PepSY-like domain-containing protein [Muribaculaceae bacterium]|nr:PepSY-like domain-containing protein [Muribaculaceae bacterium]